MKTINNRQYEECSVQAPVINPDNTINILTQKDSWSRDEVIALIEKHTTDMFKQRITLDEWISKNL